MPCIFLIFFDFESKMGGFLYELAFVFSLYDELYTFLKALVAYTYTSVSFCLILEHRRERDDVVDLSIDMTGMT